MEPLTLPDLTAITFQLSSGVVLRRCVRGDEMAVLDAVQRNIDHLHFMHWITPEYSLEMATEFVERSTKACEAGESLGFGVFRDDRMIGSIGFTHFNVDARRTEIGYWIDKDEEGKGIVSEACKLLIDFAFKDLGMNKIDIRCSAKNVRSAAIPRRFGFTQEGLIRQAEMRQGELHDFLWFGLLRSEWERPAEPPA